MKKVILGFSCLFVFMSCEIPQSITIIGHPGVYVPLGSPFKEGNRLEDYISSAKILEMMGGLNSNTDLKIYDYQTTNRSDGVDPEVQAFVVRYPIIKEWEIPHETDFDINDFFEKHPEIFIHLLPAIGGKQNYVLAGDYTLENSLGAFLGGNVRYNEVRAYIYMNGINDASMTLKAGSTTLYDDETLSPQAFRAPPADQYTGSLSPHSLASSDKLKDVFNNIEKDESIDLEYEIKIPLTVENIQKKFSLDLVILLPLEFSVYSATSSTEYPYNEYVKLDLADIFPKPSGGDLFGRKDGEGNDVLNNIDSVKITMKNFKNDIIGGSSLAILVSSDPFIKLIDFGTNDPFLEITREELPYPFSPWFEILLKKEKVADSFATLKLKRQTPGIAPKFDFFLTVEARADINYTINFK